MADHRKAAVEVAVQMQETVAGLRVKWMEDGYPSIKIRIGIHSAKVFVGNIGATDRMKYGVLGDGVNLASRLEELNKRYSTSILISSATYNDLNVKRSFICRPVDFVIVKGRSKPTIIFEVMARQDPPGSQMSVTKQIARTHSKAVYLYQDRYFEECAELLSTVIDLRHGSLDGPAEFLRRKARHYIDNPPDKSWTGVDKLQEKHF